MGSDRSTSMFIKSKILLRKVARYASQIIKFSLMGGLTYCVASGEMLSKANAL